MLRITSSARHPSLSLGRSGEWMIQGSTKEVKVKWQMTVNLDVLGRPRRWGSMVVSLPPEPPNVLLMPALLNALERMLHKGMGEAQRFTITLELHQDR